MTHMSLRKPARSVNRALRTALGISAAALISLSLAACDPLDPAASGAAPAQSAPAPAPAPSATPATTPAAGAPAAAPADGAAAPAGNDPVAQVDAFIASKKIDKTKNKWKEQLPKPELATFDKTKTYYWNLKTNKGEMRLKLMPDIAPMHVTNCIYLTRLGFYDGTSMHRVIKGFMAQGGCPQGTGRGNPGYRINLEISPTVKHDKPGVLSTANSGPNTDGSQYFIMFASYPSLDGKYSIYGQLDTGLDTLKKLEAVGASGDGPPSESLIVETATITVE